MVRTLAALAALALGLLLTGCGSQEPSGPASYGGEVKSVPGGKAPNKGGRENMPQPKLD